MVRLSLASVLTVVVGREKQEERSHNRIMAAFEWGEERRKSENRLETKRSFLLFFLRLTNGQHERAEIDAEMAPIKFDFDYAPEGVVNWS